MYRGLLPFTRTSCICCVLGNEQSLSFLLRVASDCIRFHPDCTVSRIFSTQLLKAAFSISFKHYVSVSWMLTGTELHGISEDFTVWFTREVRPWKGCPGRNPSWRLSWKKPFLKLKGCMLRQVTIEHSEREKDKAKMQFFIPSDAGKICAVLFQWRSALQSDIRHSYCTCSQNLAESGISQSRLKFFETVPFRREDPVLDPSMVRWGIANSSKALDWLARRTCKIYCTDIQDWFWPDSVLHTEAVAADLSWTPLNASFLATVAREDSFKVCICGGATSIGASEAVWLTWVERIWHWHVWHVIT